MHYRDLCAAYEALEATSKRLEKTHLLAGLLRKAKEADLPELILLLQGRVFPAWDDRKIGVASKMVLKAICQASGLRASAAATEWKRTGDLGLVAQNLIEKKKQGTLFSQELSVRKVFSNLQRLASVGGHGSAGTKISLVAELLASASPLEARYIVRSVLEELRVGIGEGTLRDAIVWAYLPAPLSYDEEKKAIDVQDRERYNTLVALAQAAYDRTNDFAEVAKAAKKGEKALEEIDISLGTPLKVMLALKEGSIEKGFGRTGMPAQLEYKYDGFRMQVHKSGNRVIIFTRRLEDVTRQFPEVVEAVKTRVSAKRCIIDAEAVGFDAKTGAYLPFQNISQRIRRKYGIHELAKRLPVELDCFDLIQLEGKDLLESSLKERRRLLSGIIRPEERRIVIAHALTTADQAEAQAFYGDAISKGFEGIMMKSLEGGYRPGARIGTWVKIKPMMEPLDAAIVGAEWGEGKRGGWLTSFTIAVRDDEGSYATVGKVGTGLKEKREEGLSFDEMTKLLRPLITAESGRDVMVRPEVIIEVNYEEIQKSPTYSSGFALRFPRVVRLREDRNEPSRISYLEHLYKGQGR
ncbi:ATP-dependent DNA ligase [Candidatus Woesearchaeota archaeon]|nr:ATP-dependent DNA ligase [Candidatus Woesearchaeota archaeon]